MTLQLLHYEFPYIWGKFYFIFYQCIRFCELFREYGCTMYSKNNKGNFFVVCIPKIPTPSDGKVCCKGLGKSFFQSSVLYEFYINYCKHSSQELPHKQNSKILNYIVFFLYTSYLVLSDRTATKISFMYSFSGNCAASVPIPYFCVCERFISIFPRSVHIFPAAE